MIARGVIVAAAAALVCVPGCEKKPSSTKTTGSLQQSVKDTAGQVIRVTPPIVITREEAEWGIERIARALG